MLSFKTRECDALINGLFWLINDQLYEMALIIIFRTLLFLLLTSFNQIFYERFCRLVGLV